MSPETLNNKCEELARRLGWPAASVTWKAVPNGRGVELRLARKRPVQELSPHVTVTFPGCGQMLHRPLARGCVLHILALRVAPEEDAA